jgi:hypothetical protein
MNTIALKEFLDHNDIWVSSRAQTAINVQIALDSKQITPTQALEILKDLINTDNLAHDAANFELETKLVNTINQLITVVQALGKV